MKNIEFKNTKCNIVLHRYARRNIKKKLSKRYKNWIKYCAINSNGSVVDEEMIIQILLHERLLIKTEDSYITSEEGEYILINNIFMSEGKGIIYSDLTIVLAIISLVSGLILTVIEKLCNT